MATVTVNHIQNFDTASISDSLEKVEDSMTQAIRILAERVPNGLALDPKVTIHQTVTMTMKGGQPEISNLLNVKLETVPVAEWDIMGQVALILLNGMMESIVERIS